MPSYLVQWNIDVDADNPLRAAEQAWEIMRRHGSMANVFEVLDLENASSAHIDLSDPENNVIQPLDGTISLLGEIRENMP
ncbi:MAG: hypothetical protein R3C70_07120 [Geminicoccaceae bacterium]